MAKYRENISQLFNDTQQCIIHCALQAAAHPKLVFYGAFSLVAAICLFANFINRSKRSTSRRAISPDVEKSTIQTRSGLKPPSRSPGLWTPIDFKRPTALPYPNWDVHKTDPLPYRPFKHGQYHITMGLRTMKWDEWIELDNHYIKYHADKAKRIEERGLKCNKTAPEAFDGAVELLEEL